MDYLEERVIASAIEDGLFAEKQPDSGLVEQLEPFMERYGYRNG